MIVTGGKKGLLLWDVDCQLMRRDFNPSLDMVLALAACPLDQNVVAAMNKTLLHVYDIRRGKKIFFPFFLFLFFFFTIFLLL